MKEVIGNLWTYPAEARVITTNGFVKSNGAAVMGRGCAREAATRWPRLPALLGLCIRERGNIVHYMGAWDGELIIAMPVKHNWWEPADPALIVESAEGLVWLANHMSFVSIVLPRPGCGNGQLSWDTVKSLIEPILDDRFSVITFKE